MFFNQHNTIKNWVHFKLKKTKTVNEYKCLKNKNQTPRKTK